MPGLTPNRLRVLRESAEEGGSELPAGNRHMALRHAPQWWSAVDYLQKLGLVAMNPGRSRARITDAGLRRLELEQRLAAMRSLDRVAGSRNVTDEVQK